MKDNKVNLGLYTYLDKNELDTWLGLDDETKKIFLEAEIAILEKEIFHKVSDNVKKISKKDLEKIVQTIYKKKEQPEELKKSYFDFIKSFCKKDKKSEEEDNEFKNYTEFIKPSEEYQIQQIADQIQQSLEETNEKIGLYQEYAENLSREINLSKIERNSLEFIKDRHKQIPQNLKIFSKIGIAQIAQRAFIKLYWANKKKFNKNS